MATVLSCQIADHDPACINQFFAVGFSVSAALYLPTIFASNGRITALAVEAVTLADGLAAAHLALQQVSKCYCLS